MELEKLREKAREIEPTIRIGKTGLSEATINEIKKQLKTRKLVKIKMLRNFLDGKNKTEAILETIEKTESILVDKKGFIFSIYRK